LAFTKQDSSMYHQTNKNLQDKVTKLKQEKKDLKEQLNKEMTDSEVQVQ